jgi:hypothetical protein
LPGFGAGFFSFWLENRAPKLGACGQNCQQEKKIPGNGKDVNENGTMD